MNKAKRVQNTQGVIFKYYPKTHSVKGRQMNNGKMFTLPLDRQFTNLENIEKFLNGIEEIIDWSLVVNNIGTIQGYVVSINYSGHKFHDLETFLK